MLSAVVVGAAIWLGTLFARIALFPETGTSILFPPYAILTVALLLSPPRRWWMYLAASLIAHLMVDIGYLGRPLLFAVETEVANLLRALAVAGLWRRWDLAPPRFETLRSTAVFLVIAGVLGPALGAFVGATVTVMEGQAPQLANPFARVWAAWFLSTAIIGITLLPLILAVAARFRDWTFPKAWQRRLEIAVIVAGLTLSALMLSDVISVGAPRPFAQYAPVPFLLWAAMRLGPGATSAALVAVTASTVTGVTDHWGAFAGRPTDTAIISVYLFLTFISVPLLLLSSLLQERAEVVGALRAGQERYRLATSAGGVGVWDWRLDTNEIFVDPNLKSFLGYTDHEIRNHLDDWLRHVHPDDAPRAFETVGPLMAGADGSFEAEYRMVHKDGRARWVLTRGTSVPASPDTPRRLLGTTTDITTRKLAELARMDAELALRDRQREVAHLGRVTMLGQLSGALTHELRQPLTAILANARAAQRILSMPNPDVREATRILNDIIGDDARAGEVITRLNRLLRRGDPTFEILELSEVVKDGLDVLQADLRERGVSVTTELRADLPRVSGDRIELQQVLINLVMNACDAMNANPPGERRIIVGTTSDDEGGVRAFVVDRGQGIPAPDLHHVFEPFVTTKPNGLGLGLAICRSIVLSHGGQLWATNNTEKGATFHLALPALGVRGGALGDVARAGAASPT